MTAEVARKMFLERQREPDMPRAPILPSARQQELRNITHQPFQPWCEACVLGRSRQSPHIGQEGEAQEVPQEARPEPMIQIDYAYTFTKQKHEVQEGEADVQSAPARGEGGAPPMPASRSTIVTSSASRSLRPRAAVVGSAQSPFWRKVLAHSNESLRQSCG